MLSVVDRLQTRLSAFRSTSRFSQSQQFGSNSGRKVNLKRTLPLLILLLTAGVTIIWFTRLIGRIGRGRVADSRVQVAGARATIPLDQEFSFPVRDSAKKTVTNIKFILENAELRDEIIVQGKRATAVQGRTFLIVTFKITSDFTRSLEINTKNYFRLTVNGNESDLLASEIHNDPVVVQPMSTKYTRIGWPIYDTDRDLILLVGEIEGEKTQVELNI